MVWLGLLCGVVWYDVVCCGVLCCVGIWRMLVCCGVLCYDLLYCVVVV